MGLNKYAAISYGHPTNAVRVHHRDPSDIMSTLWHEVIDIFMGAFLPQGPANDRLTLNTRAVTDGRMV